MLQYTKPNKKNVWNQSDAVSRTPLVQCMTTDNTSVRTNDTRSDFGVPIKMLINRAKGRHWVLFGGKFVGMVME